MGMGDVSFALKFRDIVENWVTDLLERLRPLPRYGIVQNCNRFTGQIDVIFDGDTVATRCKMDGNTEPRNTMTSNYRNDPTFGDKVRIEGRPGAYWVTAVLGGPEFKVDTNLFHPQLWGGAFLHVPTAKYETYQTGLPALGSTWHAGRWDNSISFASDATGFLEIEIQWTFFTSQVKRYNVTLKNNETGGNWRKLAPNFDSGPDGDNDFQLEILIDSAGYELRIRRTEQGGGFTPGAWDLRQWIFLDEVRKVSGSEAGEAVTTEPTSFKGTDDVQRQKGPFIGPMYASPRMAQASLSGGGKITWDGAKLDWSQVFRASGLGKGYHAKDGYFDLTRPTDGIQIPIYSKAGSTTATTAGGIPLTGDQTLYYEPPWGTVAASAAFGFRIVDIIDKDFVTPSHWIMVASRNSITGTPSLELGTGEQIDHWRVPTLLNSWTNFGGTHAATAYRMLDGRTVKFKGLVKNAVPGSAALAMFTLPAEYRPSEDQVFSSVDSASAASTRLDVIAATGNVLSTAHAGVAVGFISLAPVMYYLS
jgi:hypothetical protein